jgi:hypothetical protein
VQEAFNAFEAEHKLMQMEKDIRHEFLYGAFCSTLKVDLVGWMATPSSATCAARSGLTGLSFKQEQQELEKQFWDNLILWIGGGTVIIIGVMVIYFSVMAIINKGV